MYIHYMYIIYMATHSGILLSHKKKEILPSAATWIDLEGIRLSETSQRERQILYNITNMWNLKNAISE